jgi:gamma-glutamylcyclotransferase (GGCT)/AIG2-like uncharacterized protein YtfP
MKLFIYGSLKEGQPNFYKTSFGFMGKKLGELTITNAIIKIVDYGNGYLIIPHLFRTELANERVKGEVWDIEEKYLPGLAKFENGYELQEVADGIYSYVSQMLIDDDRLIYCPKNSDGVYEYNYHELRPAPKQEKG